MLTFKTIDHLQPIITPLFSCHSVNWTDMNGFSGDEFLNTIEEHGMVPLLHYQDYRTGCCQDWPENIRHKISDIAKQESVITLARLNDLKKVLLLLNENNIHPLLMKGVPLSYLHYPEPGLRPHSDTDLLIKKKDKENVSALMKEAGYKADFEVSEDFLSSQITFYKHENSDIYHAYDFHWQISNITCTFSHTLCYENLINNAQDIPELGTNARTLSNVDALLLACFHRFAHLAHSGECLIWIYDIHLLLESMNEHKLDDAFNKSHDVEIANIFIDAVKTSRRWFDTDIPLNLDNKLKTSINSINTTEIVTPGKPAGIKSHTRMAFNYLPSWHARLNYICQKLFPPADYMIWRYNIKYKFLLPFYYLYRCCYGVYALFR